jgi:putative cardiolipin synthase
LNDTLHTMNFWLRIAAPTLRRPVERWAFVVLALALLGGCASLPPQTPRDPVYAIEQPESTKLGMAFAALSQAHDGHSGFKVLLSGREAFIARAASARAAERTIDLQYFSAGEGTSTDALLSVLADAAGRGVRVRVLLDDIEPQTRRFALRVQALGGDVQVRLFNPFWRSGDSMAARIVEFSAAPARLNRRMHNKLWLADNAVAVFGSRNLGDAYFDLDGEANFSDVDLLVVGPVVADLSASFDAYWNSTAAVPLRDVDSRAGRAMAAAIRADLADRWHACNELPPCTWLHAPELPNALRDATLALHWAPARFFDDPPVGGKSSWAAWFEHGGLDDSLVRDELLLVAPYFIPSAEGLEHLRRLANAGVRVALLTNSLASTDSPAAHAGYVAYRKDLLEFGIEVYELRTLPGQRHGAVHRWGQPSPASLHAKFVVQDRRRVMLGSKNQDPRSRLHNTESWLVIDSEALARELTELFDEATALHHVYRVDLDAAAAHSHLRWTTEQDGKLLTFDVEPETDLGLRLWRSLLGALIPEHLL